MPAFPDLRCQLPHKVISDRTVAKPPNPALTNYPLLYQNGTYRPSRRQASNSSAAMIGSDTQPGSSSNAATPVTT